MPTINFVNEKKTVEVPDGANVRKEAQKAGVELYKGVHSVLNCHGFGHCASCQIRIRKGTENVSPQGFMERMRLILGPLTFFARLGQEKELRLACQTQVHGDVEIETKPELNWHGEKFWG
jgi:ferredoxin